VIIGIICIPPSDRPPSPGPASLVAHAAALSTSAQYACNQTTEDQSCSRHVQLCILAFRIIACFEFDVGFISQIHTVGFIGIVAIGFFAQTIWSIGNIRSSLNK
jgi:hypothetical protein